MSTKSTSMPELGRQQRVEESPDAHVDDVGDDGVVAGVEEGEERGVQGGHAGAEDRGCLAVVDCGQLRLQAELVGAGLAGVDELGAGSSSPCVVGSSGSR